MEPLRDLLHRIRWDAEFARGVFALGYVDRASGLDQVVPFTSVRFDPQRPGIFRVEDEDGVVLWQRPDSPARA